MRHASLPARALGFAVVGFSNVGFLLQAPQFREFADGDQGRRRSTAVVADHDGLVAEGCATGRRPRQANATSRN